MIGPSDRRLLAFELTWGGITAYYSAPTAGKARAAAAATIQEYYGRPFGKALCEMRCRRARWKDLDAAMHGDVGSIPGVPNP